MARRFYTCIVVPDASRRLHKLRIPEQALYALAAVGVLSFFVAVALGFSYAHMALKASDYDQLQAENTDLKIKTKDLQVSTFKLSTKIADLETLSKTITDVIEHDPAFKGNKKLNVRPEGGSRVDLTTAQLTGNGNLAGSVDKLRDQVKGLEYTFVTLGELTNQHVVMYDTTPNKWPVHGRVGSQYGSRLDPFTGGSEMHVGLDIVAPIGTQVVAPAAGFVEVARRESDYGNLVVINHGNGLTTRYAHLKNGFEVHVGDHVTKGQLIGRVGITGRTTAAHLHYEVRQNDKPVNPRSYLLGD